MVLAAREVNVVVGMLCFNKALHYVMLWSLVEKVVTEVYSSLKAVKNLFIQSRENVVPKVVCSYYEMLFTLTHLFQVCFDKWSNKYL